MQINNNERGSALMIVLFLVVVFTILGVGLLTMNTSAAKQLNKKEEQVQARHQAEMGLLHYKSEIDRELKNYTFQKRNDETAEEALNRSMNDLCNNISGIGQLSSSDSNMYYLTESEGICEKTLDGKAILKLISEGTSNKTLKIITGTASFTPPNIIDGDFGVIPGKPQLPEGGNIKEGPNIPDDSPFDVEVNGPVQNRKEKQSFGGSLIINKAPKNQITFNVGGGKEYNLTVAKDFYVGGDFHTQVHSCIIVKGDLTILGESHFGNKSVIVVYGDAYFEKEPTTQNKHSQIYVAGNTYVGIPPEITTIYKGIPTFDDCKKPGDLKEPYEPEIVNPNIYHWKLEDKLNPVYE